VGNICGKFSLPPHYNAFAGYRKAQHWYGDKESSSRFCIGGDFLTDVKKRQCLYKKGKCINDDVKRNNKILICVFLQEANK
jgi:hypothetical protein